MEADYALCYGRASYLRGLLMSNSTAKPNDTTAILRLDKWLWACRFYKTRSLAKDMIDGGKVQYNGQRCKASRNVELGATIKFTQGTDERTVLVKGLSEHRRAAPLAQQLYEETAESITLRAERAELRKMNLLFAPHPERKPDKKMRRQLLLLKSQQ